MRTTDRRAPGEPTLDQVGMADQADRVVAVERVIATAAALGLTAADVAVLRELVEEYAALARTVGVANQYCHEKPQGRVAPVSARGLPGDSAASIAPLPSARRRRRRSYAY